MTKKLFTVRDAKGEIFHTPFPQLTHADAERTFSRYVNDNQPNNQISEFPEDFDLFYLGEFDDVAGKFSLLPTPQHVIKGIQLKKPNQQQPTV